MSEQRPRPDGGEASTSPPSPGETQAQASGPGSQKVAQGAGSASEPVSTASDAPTGGPGRPPGDEVADSTGSVGDPDGNPRPTSTDEPIDVESLIAGLEVVTRERDDLRDRLLRQAADLDNVRKRSQRDVADAGRAAVGRFVEALLPVLDACDAALGQGADGVEPIAKALLAAVEQQGLVTVGIPGEAFDPNVHEAVMVDDAGAEGAPPTVIEVLRTGYRWNDRVLRAAMVKVSG